MLGDVVVNGKLLSVYGVGETRFRVLRVRQVNPYLVVDAVPLVDEDEVEDFDGGVVAVADDGFAVDGGGRFEIVDEDADGRAISFDPQAEPDASLY